MTETRTVIDSLLTFTSLKATSVPHYQGLYTCSKSKNRLTSMEHGSSHKVDKPDYETNVNISTTVGRFISATLSFISKVRPSEISNTAWKRISFFIFFQRQLWQKKQTEESVFRLLCDTDEPARLVTIITKLQAQRHYDLLSTEVVASGDSRPIH